ncbi:MAG: helix-hairpin-helix domain-containing protein [Deltaproteobacteria bacterium]|nr:helix-hairpin-helix domain-containing protein [Deltaproteobacteria bacterium]
MARSRIDPKAYLLFTILLFTLYLVRYHLIPAIPATDLTSSRNTEYLSPPVTVTHGEGRLVMGLPIDINTAKAIDLTALPGIGPTIAERMVRTREEMDGFASVDDLRRVKGIGPKKLEAIREFVVCNKCGGE